MAKKKEKVIEEKEVKKETKKEVAEEVKEQSATLKPSKKSKILSEIKAFLGIILIIGLFSIGGWYWYNHMNPRSNEKPKDESNVDGKLSYKYDVYSSKDDIYVEGNYIIEHDGQTLKKINSLNGEVLFNKDFTYSYSHLGIDGTLYFILEEDIESQNTIQLYKLENNDLVLVEELHEDDVYLDPIVYYDKNDKEYLLGFAGQYFECIDSTDYSECSSFIYSLDGKHEEFEGYEIIGDENRSGAGEEYIIYNSRYIPFGTKEVGLFDIEKMEIAIEPTYSCIRSASEGAFIVGKDGLNGVINVKQKRLVDTKYNYIQYNNVYMLVKDNKIALMDNNFKMITDFVFAYQDPVSKDADSCCGFTDSVFVQKAGSKYLLVTNRLVEESSDHYTKNEAYIIDGSGKYEVVPQKGIINIINGGYGFKAPDAKKITVYDENLNLKGEIDLSDYDIKLDDIKLGKVEDLLMIDEPRLYFDYETLKEVENYYVTYENMNVKLEYSEDKVKVMVDEKEIATLNNVDSLLEVEYINNGFYINDSNNLIIFREK